jgi:glutathione S-transferase
MTLHGVMLSPFVMRCLLVARAKGHELPATPPAHAMQSPEYLALNPMGKVPVLLHDGLALPESGVIAEYLDEVLDGPSLAGETAAERARVRLLARVGDVYVVPHLGAVFAARQHPDGLEPALAKLGEAMGYLAKLGLGSDAMGDRFSLADAALMPLFFFFEALDATTGTGRLAASEPAVAAWWERAKASEHGQRMAAEMGAALQAFMKR